jgi:hypothetical protein
MSCPNNGRPWGVVNSLPPAGILQAGEADAFLRGYLRLRLDAFRGLIFAFFSELDADMCEAKLQIPFFHLIVGSGHEEQYHPLEYWDFRSQPSQFSTISWQIPPL